MCQEIDIERRIPKHYDIGCITQHFINQSKRFCFHRIHEAVPKKVVFNFLPGMPGVFTHKMEQLCLQSFLLSGGNAHVFCIPLSTTSGWVHVNGCVGQCITFTFSSGSEQSSSH